MRSDLIAVSAVAAMAACVPALGGITYLSQARSVEAQAGFTPPGSLYQSFSAADFSQFAQVATVSDPPSQNGSGSATQNSSLGQSQITNAAAVTASDSIQTSFGTAASRFLVTLSVTEPTPWTLSGGWYLSQNNLLTGPGFASARVTILEDGATLYDNGAPTPPALQPTTETGSFNASGTLVPGRVYSVSMMLTERVGPAANINGASATLNATVAFGPAVPVTGACCTGTDCAPSNAGACAGSFLGEGTACSADPANPTTCCPANYDGAGGVNVADIFSFLSGWFAQAPAANFNGDGVVNVADIFAFLSAWFAGC